MSRYSPPTHLQHDNLCVARHAEPVVRQELSQGGWKMSVDEADGEQEERSTDRQVHMPCYWVNAAGFPTEAKRTIVMTGVARTGTSFIGAVAGRLGVPQGRDENDRVSG